MLGPAWQLLESKSLDRVGLRAIRAAKQEAREHQSQVRRRGSRPERTPPRLNVWGEAFPIARVRLFRDATRPEETRSGLCDERRSRRAREHTHRLEPGKILCRRTEAEAADDGRQRESTRSQRFAVHESPVQTRLRPRRRQQFIARHVEDMEFQFFVQFD